MMPLDACAAIRPYERAALTVSDMGQARISATRVVSIRR
jgi:hypothetical protein